MISALQHWSYCPRQCGLIHLEQVWDDNVFTIRGSAQHERADEPMVRMERGRRVLRALPIWSRVFGIVGRADVVEFLPNGAPYPIEYKSGKAKRRRHEAIQLCAQALCLEEMFAVEIPEGAIYYVASKKREPVKLDAALRASTVEIIDAVRSMASSGQLPPAKYDGRCRDCSLIDACLPQMLSKAANSRDLTFQPLSEVNLP